MVGVVVVVATRWRFEDPLPAFQSPAAPAHPLTCARTRRPVFCFLAFSAAPFFLFLERERLPLFALSPHNHPFTLFFWPRIVRTSPPSPTQHEGRGESVVSGRKKKNIFRSFLLPLFPRDTRETPSTASSEAVQKTHTQRALSSPHESRSQKKRGRPATTRLVSRASFSLSRFCSLFWAAVVRRASPPPHTQGACVAWSATPAGEAGGRRQGRTAGAARARARARRCRATLGMEGAARVLPPRHPARTPGRQARMSARRCTRCVDEKRANRRGGGRHRARFFRV